MSDQPAGLRGSGGDWQHRRRLAAVFGDVLPETTADEQEPGSGDAGGDAWLRAQVPPHHG